MSVLAWIIASGVAMMLAALAGGLLLALRRTTAQALIVPLVAFAAGSLIGSAFFHMLPGALTHAADTAVIFLLAVIGFSTFFALEQLLEWHHHHTGDQHGHAPMTNLILIGDGLHNFIDGVAIAGAFVVDVRLGITTLIATAAHEIPQEFGDLAVLLHGGWPRRRALLFNVLAQLTFLVGALLAYALRESLQMSYVVAFAAGNFLYLGATDLVPEVRGLATVRENLVSLGMFLLGIGAMYGAALLE